MFRVTFYCDDKRLGDCLRSIAGYAHGQPEVMPVVNAAVGANGLMAKTSGNAAEMFIAWIKQNKKTEVRAKDAREFLRSIGRSTGSATYTLTEAVKLGALRKHGKGANMAYAVSPEKK